MFVPGILDWIKQYARVKKSKRGKLLSPYGIKDWALEDRCTPVVRTMSTAVLHTLRAPTPPPIIIPPPVPVPPTPPPGNGGGLGGSGNFTFLDPPMPSDTVGGDVSRVVFLGNATVGQVPTKTFTIYNNSDQTIYPFLYNSNVGQVEGVYYDPFEKNNAHNQEFRQYVGYVKDSKQYLGLLGHTSISITVPLVFWDAGRMAIATDGASILPTSNGQINTNTRKDTVGVVNPFRFEYFNLDGTPTDRAIVSGVRTTNLITNVSSQNGLVMYYHCSDQGAEDPGIDAPDQLLEYTIRDKEFLTRIGIPPSSNQLVTLINYDVSYLDHLLAPVAMAGLNVPITDGHGTVIGNEDYGWIGAENPYRVGQNNLQDIIRNFTKNNDPINGLGSYFDGLGWPTFFNPNYDATTNPGVGVRIPGGANIIFDSPLAGAVSSYSKPYGPINHWMLSSGGDQPIKFSQTGTVSSTDTSKITIATPREFLSYVKAGWIVTTNEQGPDKPLGIVQSVDATTGVVTLTAAAQNLIPNQYIYSIIMSSPVSDPYAERLRSIWYSWSRYYTNLFANFQDVDLQATVKKDDDSVAGTVDDTRILQFATAPTTQLAVGMQVTKVNNTAMTSLITILKISEDRKTVYLSQPIPNVQDGQQVTVTFSKPPAINTFGDNITGLFDIDENKFGNYPGGLQGARQFAGNVYEVLSVFSTINPRKVPKLPGSYELIGNSIGGNVGFLPTANYGPSNKPVALKNISADIRDVLKSALRGVPDFSKYAEGKWYPPPSEATGGRTYNVFNIDPFVWFVHRQAGLSGYGFSFDDDASDVGANQATELKIVFGGLNGLTNRAEWFASTPWGAKSNVMVTTETINRPSNDPLSKYNGLSMMTVNDPRVYFQIKPDDPANALSGAFVSGSNIPVGTFLRDYGLIDAHQFVLSVHVPDMSTPFPVTFSGKPIGRR